MINVVAAVILRNGKYLIAQKPAKKGGNWEFPGGKVEINENLTCALIREIHEELGVKIRTYEVLDTIEIQTNGQSYRIHFISAELIDDRFILSEHQALKWVDIDGLLDAEMSSADLEFVKHIRGL